MKKLNAKLALAVMAASMLSLAGCHRHHHDHDRDHHPQHHEPPPPDRDHRPDQPQDPNQ